MPFLTIAGVEVRVTEFERGEDERGGEMRRTLSGQRRGSPLWVARNWNATALCLTDAEAIALRALADDLTPRVCAGDAFPVPVTCHVQAVGEPYERQRAEWWRTPRLVLREVL